MIRFLHTSDWQLGMTRHFFSEGAQERYGQARIDAIRTLGRVAGEEKCRFMLVCGDTFESNQVDQKTVARALEALKDVPVPVFFLPGNHDSLNAASVYRSSTFLERKPEHVHVIESASPLEVAGKVELVGAPWLSRRPVTNPVEEALATLAPADGTTRICLAHGAVDRLAPDEGAAGIIRTAVLERALAEEKVQYVALGDRHSLTRVSAGDRICYSGTPEAADFSEVNSGRALVVEITGGTVTVREVTTGRWRFIRREAELNAADDIEALRRSLEEVESKAQAVVRLILSGSLTLSARDRLQAHLDYAENLFGAFDLRDKDLLVMPDDADFADLGFSGFIDLTVRELRGRIASGGDGGNTARDALMLLLRLARNLS